MERKCDRCRCRYPAAQSLFIILVWCAPLAHASDWGEVTGLYDAHYVDRLGSTNVIRTPIEGGHEIAISSERLKGPGNQPVLLLHADRTKDVILLVHGLTDSPYYMRSIADRFFAAGANVVLPLLPGHGLAEPDEALEDGELAEQWKYCVEHAVIVASLLGDRVSIGGLSTGGALSVYTALEDPERVNGGIFLFSAALSVGWMNEMMVHSPLLVPAIARLQDGKYPGVGPNPYKYPEFTRYGGLHLTRLINEIKDMLGEAGPKQKVFAVHSIHDKSAFPDGLGRLLRAKGTRGVAIIVANNPPIEHASLVLDRDIELDAKAMDQKKPAPTPRANPSFEGMMNLALTFFEHLPPVETGP